MSAKGSAKIGLAKGVSDRALPQNPEPVAYKRWRHLTQGYIAIVLETKSIRGTLGVVTYVSFRAKDKDWWWPVGAFTQAFLPVGRRLRRKSSWDRL